MFELSVPDLYIGLTMMVPGVSEKLQKGYLVRVNGVEKELHRGLSQQAKAVCDQIPSEAFLFSVSAMQT